MKSIQQLLLAVYRLPAVTALMRTRLGSRLYVLFYDIYKDRLEAVGSNALAAYIPPGTWAIDVGANIGFFTERFARWVKNGGRVIAIEPDSENLDLLRQRMARCGFSDVVLLEAVAAEQSGTMRLQRNPQQPTDHRIADSGDPVDALTLDEIVQQVGNPVVGLIKIDTQGSEHRVLDGASKLLRRCRPNLFIEIDDGALRSGGASAVQLIKQIQAAGYRFMKISSKGQEERVSVADLIASFDAAERPYIDVLCVPDLETVQAGGTARSGE